MKFRHQLAAYLGLLGMIVLVAILLSVRDRLITIGPWVLDALLAACGLVAIYLLHKLYVKLRLNHLALTRQREEVEREKQARAIEADRWLVERAGLLLGQHLQVSRIYPDGKGYLPTLVQITPDGERQLLTLPRVGGHQLSGQPQPLLLPGTRVSESTDAGAAAIPVSVRYEEIRAAIPAGRVCLGVSERGVEHCDFGQLMTCWIVGGSSTGKSNTVALKIDEAIRNGRKIRILLIDPHARKEDSLYNKIRCYEHYFLAPVAISEAEIRSTLEWFKAEFERRLEQGGRGQSDILLVCDEVSNVVESDDEEIGKLIKKIARICGQESRGFGMFGWFISQDAAGLSWLRKRAMTVIAHKLNMMSERKLACNEDMEIARQMDSWPRGRVAVYGLNFQGVMIAQMPAFSPPPVVDGSIEENENEGDEMEPLQAKKTFPSSTIVDFQAEQWKRTGNGREAAQETAGNETDELSEKNAALLKKMLQDIRGKLAQGRALNTILREDYGVSGGRAHQEIKALLEATAD